MLKNLICGLFALSLMAGPVVAQSSPPPGVQQLGPVTPSACAAQGANNQVQSAATQCDGSPPCTLFANSATGNDANSGLTPALAVQSLPHLQALWLATTNPAGAVLCLADGSDWRSSLVISSTGTVPPFTAYPLNGLGIGNVTVRSWPGTGTRPIIDGSDVLPAANFVSDGAGAYKTNAAVTLALGGGSYSAWLNVFETGASGDNATGTPLIYETSQAAMDSTPGSYYCATLTTSVIPASCVIFVHATDGTNPATSGYVYEATQRAPLIMTSPGGKIIGIEGRKPAYNNGSISAGPDGAGTTINNVVVRDGGKHNLLIPEGSTLTNSIVIDGYYPNGDGMVVVNTNYGGGLTTTLTGNICQMDQLVSGNGQAQCFFGHVNVGGVMGTIQSSNNWFIAKNAANLVGVSFGTGTITGVNENGDNMSQLTVGIIANSTGPINITSTNYYSTVAGNIWISAFQANYTLNLLGNNACVGNIASSQGAVFENGVFTGTINAEENNFLTGTTASGYNIFFYNHSTGTVTYNFSANDFGSNQNVLWYPIVDANAAATFAGNSNIYESSTHVPNWKLKSNTAATSLALWQTLVSPSDAAATESGGNAVAACTLPPMPVVN